MPTDPPRTVRYRRPQRRPDPEAREFVRRHEGGRVNRPDDAGGPTNQGITRIGHEEFHRRRGGDPTHVNVMDLSQQEIEDIYADIWERSGADSLNTAGQRELARTHFDTYVMSEAKARAALEAAQGDPRRYLRRREELLQEQDAENQRRGKQPSGGWHTRTRALARSVIEDQQAARQRTEPPATEPNQPRQMPRERGEGPSAGALSAAAIPLLLLGAPPSVLRNLREVYRRSPRLTSELGQAIESALPHMDIRSRFPSHPYVTKRGQGMSITTRAGQEPDFYMQMRPAQFVGLNPPMPGDPSFYANTIRQSGTRVTAPELMVSSQRVHTPFPETRERLTGVEVLPPGASLADRGAEYTNQVFGHEGRHRASALAEILDPEETMPVGILVPPRTSYKGVAAPSTHPLTAASIRDYTPDAERQGIARIGQFFSSSYAEPFHRIPAATQVDRGFFLERKLNELLGFQTPKPAALVRGADAPEVIARKEKLEGRLRKMQRRRAEHRRFRGRPMARLRNQIGNDAALYDIAEALGLGGARKPAMREGVVNFLDTRIKGFQPDIIPLEKDAFELERLLPGNIVKSHEVQNEYVHFAGLVAHALRRRGVNVKGMPPLDIVLKVADVLGELNPLALEAAIAADRKNVDAAILDIWTKNF